MEIILLEKVTRLGNMGDIVTVKGGFARNYLIPQGKALRATAENKAEFEARKEEIAKQNQARKTEAEQTAKQLAGMIVELVRQASDDGRLYGSVTVRDIGEFLEGKGFKIPRQNLLLEKAIKEVGSYTVTVMLHPEVEIELAVRVARNESEFLDWEDEQNHDAQSTDAAAASAEAENASKENSDNEAEQEQLSDTKGDDGKDAAA